MSIATFTNIITILFCLAVLVQSVRMMRSIQTVKDGQLARTVDALEKATAQARTVLSDLKQTLASDGLAASRTLAEAKEIRDELGVMIGIGNAVAERLMDAASPATSKADPMPEAEPSPSSDKPIKAAPTRKAKTPRRPKAPAVTEQAA